MAENQKTTAKRIGYDRRTYKILSTIDKDPYWDEGWSTHGSGRGQRWAKRRLKRVFPYQYRMYRTWKYNRKTKWKDKCLA